MEPVQLSPAKRQAFNAAVWEIVRQVPAGRVTTYGQVAGFIPCPDGVAPGDFAAFRARWVGDAMAASPAGVPWQRVINAQGKISARRVAAEQRQLLEAEGIVFDEQERVDLARYGWEGPPVEWLRERGFDNPDEPRQPSLF
jgi:methylated-DNA-protein-cysteine methyltransferase related protein